MQAAGARPAATQAPEAGGNAVGTRADTAWVLEKLARPAPMRTSFVELRSSRLLKEPLRLAGEYRRPDADTLVREVRTPYAETTTIATGAGAAQATIERGGRSRSFSLDRVPELANLQASFGALLAGDRAALERHYAIATRGTRTRWVMALVPKREALAGQVREIVLHGRGSELRCIETVPAGEGATQRTLLATAARAVEAGADAATITAACRDASG